jgi:FAD:protein FMN transferase
LAHRGYENFLVELGGEIRVRGVNAKGKPWRVAVQRPDAKRTRVQAFVELRNAAIATSGDYHRYFEHQGRRYSHIIDPTTGRPIEHQLAAVTVAADDALTADAWDTALLVLGPERGYDTAVEHDIAALFITRDGDRFIARETPAWKTRFPAAERN